MGLLQGTVTALSRLAYDGRNGTPSFTQSYHHFPAYNSTASTTTATSGTKFRSQSISISHSLSRSYDVLTQSAKFSPNKNYAGGSSA